MKPRTPSSVLIEMDIHEQYETMKHNFNDLRELFENDFDVLLSQMNSLINEQKTRFSVADKFESKEPLENFTARHLEFSEFSQPKRSENYIFQPPSNFQEAVGTGAALPSYHNVSEIPPIIPRSNGFGSDLPSVFHPSRKENFHPFPFTNLEVVRLNAVPGSEIPTKENSSVRNVSVADRRPQGKGTIRSRKPRNATRVERKKRTRRGTRNRTALGTRRKKKTGRILNTSNARKKTVRSYLYN